MQLENIKFQFIEAFLITELHKAKEFSNRLLPLSEGGEPIKKYSKVTPIIEKSLSRISIYNKILIIKEFETSLPELLIERSQISIVLTSILQNSIESFKKTQNRGLGLTISHSIIKKNSGELHITSTKGEGTTVTIRLPTYKELQSKQNRYSNSVR